MTRQEALFTLTDTRGADTPPADPFTAAVPGWLREALEDVNPARRSAYVKLHPCPRCASPVLTAADMGLDLMADSTVDPALLTADTEVEALLAGRYTAELDVSRHGAGVMVFRRDRWLMLKPAGARGRFAVPEHRCRHPLGVPIPWQILYPRVYAQAHQPPKEHDDTPPF